MATDELALARLEAVLDALELDESHPPGRGARIWGATWPKLVAAGLFVFVWQVKANPRAAKHHANVVGVEQTAHCPAHLLATEDRPEWQQFAHGIVDGAEGPAVALFEK